ncbi:hypothetical protein [Streptomyces sp. CS62]|uniref:hypothetical protein n=1 Tax=Streptomyces sp. CS62 TaxID=3119268 RepID=UPI002F942B3D
MRPVQDRDGAPAASHTPIYDTLCAEYLRAFRALPGDRTGEEDLAFTGFSYGGSYTTGTAAYGASWSGSGWQPEPWQPPYAPAPAPAAPQPSYAYAGGSAAAGLHRVRRRAAAPDRDAAHPGGPAARSAPGLLTPRRRYFFLCWPPRFSRTRTEMWIGVPSKPNSSRRRRSMNRR